MNTKVTIINNKLEHVMKLEYVGKRCLSNSGGHVRVFNGKK